MHYYRRVEQILSNLRPVLSRCATFEWFVILIWGILLCNGHPAITSYLNAVGLTPHCYSPALLLEAGSCLFAVPVTFELQDGIKTTKDDGTTVVDKISALRADTINVGSYIIFYSKRQGMKRIMTHARANGLYLLML